jgi:hypothetical protein
VRRLSDLLKIRNVSLAGCRHGQRIDIVVWLRESVGVVRDGKVALLLVRDTLRGK